MTNVSLDNFKLFLSLFSLVTFTLFDKNDRNMRKYFWISLALKATERAREIQKYFLMFLSFFHLNSSPSFACFYSKRKAKVFPHVSIIFIKNVKN
jgi:hypothetical protein